MEDYIDDVSKRAKPKTDGTDDWIGGKPQTDRAGDWRGGKPKTDRTDDWRGEKSPGDRTYDCRGGRPETERKYDWRGGKPKTDGTNDWRGGRPKTDRASGWRGGKSPGDRINDWRGGRPETERTYDWRGGKSPGDRRNYWSGGKPETERIDDWRGEKPKTDGVDDWRGGKPKTDEVDDWREGRLKTDGVEDWRGARPKTNRTGVWRGEEPINVRSRGGNWRRDRDRVYATEGVLDMVGQGGKDAHDVGSNEDERNNGHDARIYKRGRGRGGGRGGGRGVGSTTRELNFKGLRDLLAKEPSSIVMALGFESGLSDLLQRSSHTPNLMFELLKVLLRACSCATAPESLLRIVLIVHNSRFYDIVTDILKDFNTKSNLDKDDQRQFIKNVLLFMKDLSVRLPHSFMSVKVLGLQSFLGVVIYSPDTTDIIDDDIRTLLKELYEAKSTVVTLIQKGELQKGKDATPGPPNDFREISVFPTHDDLDIDEPPYLRKSIAHGGYKNLDHYLDVQFRLLREDFICPLREGIQGLQASGSRHQRNRDIKVYNDVQVLRTVCSESGLLHRVMLDVSKLKRIKWENSNRLIYGSLLCFSSDNFDTFFFATVIDRDLVKQGLIDVQFEYIQEINEKVSFEARFIMVETTAFFEAYKHVLRGLQLIKRDEMPFERYIVSCENDVQPPQYLQTKDSTKYDLRPLVDDKIVLRERTNARQQTRQENIFLLRGRTTMREQTSTVIYDFNAESKVAENIDILDQQEWPPATVFHLDQSQYEALKTALSKEFVIIQGPPGTGKTYVGLKIVKALIHNSQIWNNGQRSPMLIVCYTNHALDQFLEGILDFFSGDIIRVGGRSKSDRLAQYSLKSKKFEARIESSGMHKETVMEVEKLKKQLKDLRSDIEKIGKKMEAAGREILHEDILQPYMGHHFGQLSKPGSVRMENKLIPSKENTSGISEWLGLGNIHDLINTAQHQVNEDPKNIDKGEDAVDDADDDVDDDVDVQLEADSILQQRRLDVDENDDFFETDREMLTNQVEHLQKRRETYVAFDISSLGKAMPLSGNRNEHWERAGDARKHLKIKLLKKLRTTQGMKEDFVKRVINVWNLQEEDRWKLYKYWAHKMCEGLRREIRTTEMTYRTTFTRYRESQMIEDKQVLQKASIIGMTTTGAARYREHLAEIGPKIIVVEEAAEVLEAHIIATLSHKCEHLILIGDHKQLKPNPTVYRLAKYFNLDLSMFERMVTNGVHCDTLALQHRMRPEIAALVKHIYPKLQNHSSVYTYANVRGVSANVYFINHRHSEDHETEGASHSNHFEASYIVALCKYLLKQGYKRSQITVLTTYSGQMFKLKTMMPKDDFEGVRLAVVDNFQGEECEIILLSLVRSNSHGNVGFLKIENRVCVALSRAKVGLFITGNFDLLAHKSLLWKRIVNDAKVDNRFGSTLTLSCQNHPQDSGIVAGKPEDFQKAPEGGCEKSCMFRLECGHVCTLKCHPYDIEHKLYRCQKPCLNICVNNHTCQKRCYELCGECEVLIEKTIQQCGHLQMVPCSQDPSKFNCKISCQKLCENEHLCRKLCFQKWRDCIIPMKKTISECGHQQMVPCSQSPSTFECKNACEKVCENGHPCKKLCHEKCGACLVPVEKIIPLCGHKQVVPCSQEPSTFKCNVACKRMCDNNHPSRKLCYQKWRDCLVQMTKTIPECGHEQTIPCSRNPSTFDCKMICEKQCTNNHTCQKLCFQKWKDCLIPVQKTIPLCGHQQMVPCSQDPSTMDCKMPCEKTCQNGHPCPRLCHQQCGKCLEPVEKTIPDCGHHQMVPCSQDPSTFKCKMPCKEGCINGHPCQKLCHEKCGDCVVLVEKTIAICGHQQMVPCSLKQSEYKCRKVCEKLCENDHPCRKLCFQKWKDCLIPVQKVVPLCGHKQRVLCSQDPATIDCRMPCRKTCQNGHPCRRLCHQKCGKCLVPVENIIPDCGHQQMVPCSQDPSTFKCKMPCKEVCENGHPCQKLCHEKCSDCLVLIQKTIPLCGHTQFVPCHKQPSTFLCRHVCQKVCKSGHPCRKFCFERCGDCRVLTKKVMPDCGHQQMIICAQSASTYDCQQEVEKTLKCGHISKGMCGQDQHCRVLVERRRIRCGHTERVECGLAATTKCKVKCSSRLKCGHVCSGNCNGCHEGRLHVVCTQNCKILLICGHECRDRCSVCLPCAKTCENRCSHDKCLKKCGDLCSPCSKPCTWKCEHYSCTKTCGEPCDRPPCNEPCPLLLPCGHPCIGLCGEPCPRLCRECNPVEVNAISAGANADAMFVELEDCKHIIEVTTLDKHMAVDCQSNTVLELKTCPNCKTPIRRNVRYGKYINAVLQNIENLKRDYKNKIKMLNDEIRKETETGRTMKKLAMRRTFVRSYAAYENMLIVIQYQHQFMTHESKLQAAYEKLDITALSRDNELLKDLKGLREWIMQPRGAFSEQEQYDFQNEILRHKAIQRLMSLENTMETNILTLSLTLNKLIDLREMLKNGRPFAEDLQAKAEIIFETLERQTPDPDKTDKD